MEYLYDMGFFINRSMHRVLKNEGYLYDQNVRQYTPEELDNPVIMAEETFQDVLKYIKEDIRIKGLTGNTFTLCFDDKEFQIRPEYKKRPTPENQKEIKRRTQEKLLQLPDTPRLKKVVGYGLEADDWIYNLRLKNSKEGKETTFYTCDCDLLCNIDDHTTGVFFKARTSNEINKEYWDAAIDSVFRYALPYNTTWLYKITVGDASDNITGVFRFGDKAFTKLIDSMREAGIPFHTLGSYRGFTTFLEHPNGLKRFLNETQYEQAMEAWKLVSPITLDEAKQLEVDRHNVMSI